MLVVVCFRNVWIVFVLGRLMKLWLSVVMNGVDVRLVSGCLSVVVSMRWLCWYGIVCSLLVCMLLVMMLMLIMFFCIVCMMLGFSCFCMLIVMFGWLMR